jgi:hypothetical protein
MTIEFRAYVGPSAGKCHIVRLPGNGQNGTLVLCLATSAARPVTGVVNHQNLCTRCIKRMAELMREEKLAGRPIAKCDTPEGLAQAIGLEKII